FPAFSFCAWLSFRSVHSFPTRRSADLVSSLVVTVVSAPTGASFTLVTLIVIVFGDWSRSTPPLPEPQSSCTWKVRLASGEPLAMAAGVNTSLPAVMSATLMNWPALTATPLSVSVPDPALGSVVIFTAFWLLAALSFGSFTLSLHDALPISVSSLVVTVVSAPTGASFTLVTLIVIVFGDWS